MLAGNSRNSLAGLTAPVEVAYRRLTQWLVQIVIDVGSRLLVLGVVGHNDGG